MTELFQKQKYVFPTQNDLLSDEPNVALWTLQTYAVTDLNDGKTL